MEDALIQRYKQLLQDVTLFSKAGSGIPLRTYQVEVARSIAKSVIHGEGLTFVIMFPRQSGKNELQAQIETYLLAMFSTRNQEIVKVSPTWKPQSLNAMRRLQRVISRNLITRDRWGKKSGYIYVVGNSMIYFFSGSPTSSIVGATASLLLECDEAQDIQITKWDKEIAPMAASTNATRVFWGTAWTSRTLLARELAAAQEHDLIARELHDSVSQIIFSITLEAQSARLLLDKDPSRVPALLDRLQELTGRALSQMRNLISQWRPA